MSNALTNLNTVMAMWEDKHRIEEIRKLFAPRLTETEFQFFIGLGKATGLNPFVREIWCVKYQDNAPAQVFIGRDGYRKAAQSHSEYDFHQCDAVYENDEFEVINGEVTHKYKLTNRGALVGAYCIAKRHKSSRPMYVFAELKEYSTGKSLWNLHTGKPATMIKKVAESQCLRACFQDLLGGTYGEEELEQPQSLKIEQLSTTSTQTERLNAILDSRIIDNSYDIIEAQDVPSKEYLINEIDSIMTSKEFSKERKENAINYILSQYKSHNLDDLTQEQLQRFINQLEKA